jgi:hypothetical protein
MQIDAVQFEAIRMVAGTLISVAIAVLSLVAISG